MKGMDYLAILSGLVLTLGGTALIIVGIIFDWLFFVFGLIIFVVGLATLLTLKKQESIEPIKKVK